MGTTKCCCYLLIGIVLLSAISAWREENNWGQPQYYNGWQGSEGSGDTRARVMVTFASGGLKLGFANRGTPVGSEYGQYVIKGYLKEDYTNPISEEVQVRAGMAIIIQFTLDATNRYVNFKIPSNISTDTTLQVDEVTALVNTWVFWRVVYWEEGVLKEVNVW